MKREPEIAYIDGIQPPSNPVPRHSNILILKGRCYFQKRIPMDLVRAKCYGKATIIKRALGTGNLAEARHLAVSVAMDVDCEFAAKRREIGLPSPFAKSANRDAPALRRLSDISDIERRDFIIRAFIAKEKRESAVRSFESDPISREMKLEGAREDLAAIGGSGPYAQTDWLSMARKALEDDGISIDGTLDAASLQSIADMLRRATVENARRTERAISGSFVDARDSYFDSLHADSPLPTAAKASKTIGDLCREYLVYNEDRVKSGRLARSTIPKIKMRCLIISDFLGTGKALAAITSEDAARLVDFLPTLPNHATKRHKGISLVAAAEKEGQLEIKRLIHPETADDYLTGLSAMLSYAVERRWMKENPLKGRLVRERMAKPKKRDRQPLSSDEMERVFSSPEFLKQKQGGRGAVEARYWVPLLCLFHGTRANEVAGMASSPVTFNPSALTNGPPTLFVHDQIAGFSLVPSQGDRSRFPRIKNRGFFQKLYRVRHHRQPRRRLGDPCTQFFRRSGVLAFAGYGGGNRHRTEHAWQNLKQSQLSEPGQGGVVADHQHQRLALNDSSTAMSEWKSSTVIPGHTPWRFKTSRASQQEARPNKRRTCSSESTSCPYAAAASASSAERAGFSSLRVNSAEISSGISKTIFMPHLSPLAPH